MTLPKIDNKETNLDWRNKINNAFTHIDTSDDDIDELQSVSNTISLKTIENASDIDALSAITMDTLSAVDALSAKPYSIDQFGTSMVGGDKTGIGFGEHALDIQSDRISSSRVASGDYSTVIGYNGYATGSATTIIGYNNDALDKEQTVAGYNNYVGDDAKRSTVIGWGNTVSGIGWAGREGCQVFGYDNYVGKFWGTAIGDHNILAQYSSRAFGAHNYLYGGESIGLGFRNNVYTWRGLAVGNYNTVSATGGMAYGRENKLDADSWAAVAIGTELSGSGFYSTLVGSRNYAYGPHTLSFGVTNSSYDAYSITFGTDNYAAGAESIAMGYKNEVGLYDVHHNAVIWCSLSSISLSSESISGDLFSAYDELQNTFLSGYSVVSTTSLSSEVMGFTLRYDYVSGATAIGSNNNIYHNDSLAVGINNNVTGPNSIAFGTNNTVLVSGGVAIGSNIINEHKDSIEIGPSNDRKLSIRADSRIVFPPAPSGAPLSGDVPRYGFTFYVANQNTPQESLYVAYRAGDDTIVTSKLVGL